MNYNKVMLGGRLTRDPELRNVGQSNTALTSFGIAVNRVFGTGDARKEEVCFVDIDAWGRQAENIVKFFKKGQEIFVEGRLTYDTWEGSDGTKRNKIKVTLERFEFVGAAGSRTTSSPAVANTAPPAAPDEDLPF